MSRRGKLLYVEDHAESMAVVAQLIAGRKDLVLLGAADAERGLKLARRAQPEVILISVDLPGIGALEFMKRVRAEAGAQKTTPILALATDATPAAIVKGLEAGFFHYLAKPLQAEPFREALAYALEFAALERAEQL
jgi:CheY-like chemotaxis protein